MAVGESREVELRYLRFDVANFEEVLTREDLLALPQDVQERLWLFDLDLTSGPNTPKLLDNALRSVREIDPDTLEPAAQNLQRLLLTTPDNADLTGTSLEDVTSLAPLLGIAPERVLADLLGIGPEDVVLSQSALTQTILEQVIATHPRAQVRRGPRTADNPDGLYPVTPGALPVTLADVASDFSTLPVTFGPVQANGVTHPGFITGDVRARVLTDDFRITVRANANALPYKGVDLSDGAVASVNAIPSQIDDLFDTSDPRWLVIEGIVPDNPVIERMTFQITEHDGFVPGGREPIPTDAGTSAAWRLPPYTLERVIIGAAQRDFMGYDAEVSYFLPGDDEPVFSATVVDGWKSIDVKADLGSPPAPSYLWDVLLEVGQVRLHDGGIPEGDADARLTLTDVPIGLSPEVIEQTIRENLEANPRALIDVAARIVDNTQGAADLYYVHLGAEFPASIQGDYLSFVTEQDIRVGDDGQLERPYAYTSPGFFADEALTDKRSTAAPIATGLEDGHEHVRVEAGDVLYVLDDAGQVFRLEVGEKPSTSGLALTITRVQ